MRRRGVRIAFHAILLCVALAAARAEPAVEPDYKPPTDRDPVSGVVVRGLMWRLQQTMTGRPVIAVGYGHFRPDITWSEDDYKHAPTDIEKLQIIAAKTSAPDREMIPFQVRGAYVIAPETRDALNPDLASLSPLDVAEKGVLMADVLTRLTPEQVKALGSEQGLAVSSLPPDMRGEVARAFRPPMDIISYKPETRTNENGLPQISYSQETLGKFLQPLDWTSARFRARLRMSGVSVHLGDQMGFISSGMEGPPVLAPPHGGVTKYSAQGVDLPVFSTVPNTFKPSDLAGKAFTKPLGLAGVWTVKQVVERLSTATGLTLSVWKPYQEWPVFLGSESLPAGDVLDGLRLALTASWRKLGDGYYLVWDRMPLLAIDQMAREATASAVGGVGKQRDLMTESPGYVQLADSLPFADDDPLAPNDAQRARLFGPDKPDAPPRSAFLGVPFGELTPDQQKYIRDQGARSTLETYTQEGRQQDSRAFNEDDYQHAHLQPQAAIEVSVQIPGQGWVRMQSYDQTLQLSRHQLEKARRKAAPTDAPKPDPMADAPKEIRDALEKPRPVTLPSAVRGLVVPALSPARLDVLADEMNRHGLNVLFYPALQGGYAGFASSVFPADPALRGADGVAAAVSAMKPKDIRVVAYVDTLAWQSEKDPVHWLNKHPGWLDVDVLGRPRLQWLAAHADLPRSTVMTFLGVQPDRYNYVRASEPQVEARLKTLVREVSARKGVSALAFANWRPARPLPYGNDTVSPPALGYAMPDRVMAFQKTGADPADAVEYDALLPDSIRNISFINRDDVPDPDTARAALVGRLIKEAKAARKDWRVYQMNDNDALSDRLNASDAAPGKDAPKPDLVISNIFGTGPSALGGQGIMIPVAHKTMGDMLKGLTDAPGPDEFPSQMLAMSPITFFGTMMQTLPRTAARPPIALYDFRDAPRIITDSLKWVKPPDVPARKGTGAAK